MLFREQQRALKKIIIAGVRKTFYEGAKRWKVMYSGYPELTKAHSENDKVVMDVVFHLEKKTSCCKIHLFEANFFSYFQLEQKTF